MRKLEIKEGDRYGKLTIIKEVDPIKYSNGSIRRKVLCRCDCGNEVVVGLSNIRRGTTTSCGCMYKEVARNLRGKYPDLYGTRVYIIWYSMKCRCYKKSNDNYKHYGGRGIKMCDEWKNDFMTFYNWAINNGYSDNLTIDRIDNNGDYEPTNCRWVTMSEQANNRRTNVILTHNGESHTIMEWSKITGINFGTLQNRVYSGWDDEKILTTPVKYREFHKQYSGKTPITMFDENGTFIKNFASIKDAERETGIKSSAISNYLKGIVKTCHGYTFSYLQ